MSIKRNDDAVSPVIGVILMVAITVILAAVIAAFVFGLVGGVQGAKVVGVTGTLDSHNTFTYTWQGGADLPNIIAYEVKNSTQSLTGGKIENSVTVGEINSTTIPIVKPDRVVIVADFEDGTSQVIFDKQY